MGVSSNFGTMFSVARSFPIPQLPTNDAIQILLNNLLYDPSEVGETTRQRAHEEYIQKPKKLDIAYISWFMVIFLGSLHFHLSLFHNILPICFAVFKAAVPVFQTAWFVYLWQRRPLVVFVLRTRKTPFYKRKPGKYLLFSTLAAVAVAFVLPYTPFGAIFGFSSASRYILLSSSWYNCPLRVPG